LSSNFGKQENPSRRFFALSLLGAAFTGICILFIAAFIWFQPDQLSLSDRYFPSPTVTSTRTPTPNLTAMQRVIQATSTSQAIQTTIAHADRHWNILISDGFNSNKNNWELNNEDGYAKITRTITGVYRWKATSKKGFHYYVTADTKSVGDFLLEVEAQKTEGTRSSDYGLIFREDTRGNFYYFGINDDSFFVSLNYNNKWIYIIDWISSSAITPTTPNRLTVTANGSHFTFLINDQLVANATDTRIPRGTTGLAIQIHQSDRQATFEFDNFELREP